MGQARRRERALVGRLARVLNMQRFEIRRVKDRDDLVLVLQYPGLDLGRTLIVAPLVALETIQPIAVITPEIRWGDRRYALGTHQLAAVPISTLGPVIGHAEDDEAEISRAIDRLFFGN